MLNVINIVLQQVQDVVDWHQELVVPTDPLPVKYVRENHYWNFRLWHEEDIARIKNADPVRIMNAKRNIDQFNQHRNNCIESIDEWVLDYLNEKGISAGNRLHSETPGMMIDRLSIMALKSYHMQEEAARESADQKHRDKCGKMADLLSEQMADLKYCLIEVINKLQNGELKFKIYRQLKMYNDPDLNPQLYRKDANS